MVGFRRNHVAEYAGGGSVVWRGEGACSHSPNVQSLGLSYLEVLSNQFNLIQSDC